MIDLNRALIALNTSHGDLNLNSLIGYDVLSVLLWSLTELKQVSYGPEKISYGHEKVDKSPVDL